MGRLNHWATAEPYGTFEPLGYRGTWGDFRTTWLPRNLMGLPNHMATAEPDRTSEPLGYRGTLWDFLTTGLPRNLMGLLNHRATAEPYGTSEPLGYRGTWWDFWTTGLPRNLMGFLNHRATAEPYGTSEPLGYRGTLWDFLTTGLPLHLSDWKPQPGKSWVRDKLWPRYLNDYRWWSGGAHSSSDTLDHAILTFCWPVCKYLLCGKLQSICILKKGAVFGHVTKFNVSTLDKFLL